MVHWLKVETLIRGRVRPLILAFYGEVDRDFPLKHLLSDIERSSFRAACLF